MKIRSIKLTRLSRVLGINALLVLTLLLAACAPAASASSTPPPAATNAPTSVPTMAPTAAAGIPVTGKEAEINIVNDPKLGQILVGANGMSLYVFKVDAPDKSNCNGSCLQTWPPLLTQGSPKLGMGVDASLVGSTTLADGTKIVTYNHMPLYYYSKDSKAGDTNGQGVGSVWFVVSPQGKPVENAPAAGGGAPPAPTQPTGGGGGGGYQNPY